MIRYSAIVSLLRKVPTRREFISLGVCTTIDSNVRRVGYNTRHPAGLFCQSNRKDSPVKTRITLLAVVLGAVLFALVLADGPWPGV
jgi:hypothetical protein